ncbi:MAG: PAS domain S-box protein [Hydrogenophaga sp.]|jgi:PAS domain S-box-containing protein|nr:PAS domain S-box protein [Hydrogenophaga sp.]
MSHTAPQPRLLARLWQALLEWEPDTQSAWRRFGVAIVLTLLAAWLRMALAPAESGGRFITLSLAVALAALYGGFAAGMLSTLLGMVVISFFMIKPYGSLAFDDPGEAFWLNLWHFLTQLVVVSAIWMMQRRNRHLVAASELAQASQQQFLATFEHAAAGISHVALNGRLMRVNQTFCRMVGYSEAELLQLDFQRITHPDDVEPDVTLVEQTLAGQRSSYALEKRYLHKDGHTVWAQLTVALVRQADGSPDYFISVVQDISSVKATENALRTSQRLMQQAQTLAGFASWEADLALQRIRALSGSHLRLGLPSAEFSGEELLGLTHPDDQQRLWSEWVAALQGLAEYNSAYRARINGEDRWFSVRAEFERDASGRALRAFGVTQDITQQTLAEREIMRLNASLEQRIQERTRELKEAYDELESYSYAVAHDLRSPLRIINGFAQALEEDNPTLGDASRLHVERIKSASRKMGLLIDGLLQLSQYARGEVQRYPVNLSAVATRLLEELAADEPDRQVDWSVEADLQVLADPPLVDALLQNLLHNAWKYTTGTPQAQIRFFAREVDGQQQFCVSDNGAGFDMARSDKLFQPFQRLHQPHEFGGLGIGLATARRIVLRHGGALGAQSAPGQGATFRFTLSAGPDPADNRTA